MKQLVLKLDVNDEQVLNIAQGRIARISGNYKINMNKTTKLCTVTSDNIDPIEIVRKLRLLCRVDIIAVETPKEPEKKKEELVEEVVNASSRAAAVGPSKQPKKEDELRKEEPTKQEELVEEVVNVSSLAAAAGPSKEPKKKEEEQKKQEEKKKGEELITDVKKDPNKTFRARKMKKAVLKLDLHGEKARTKALKTVSGHPGPTMREKYNLEKKAKEAFIDDHFELAVDLYTQAIALDPTNPDLFADCAQANIKLNKFTEAVADASKAIELDASLAKAYLRKGIACMKVGKYQNAKAALEAGTSLVPGESRFTNLIKECDGLIAEETGGSKNHAADAQVNIVSRKDAVPEDTSSQAPMVIPSMPMYRHEFYQKPEEVVVSIFAKGIQASWVTVGFGEQTLSVSIEVPGEDGYHFQPRLFGKIKPDECKYNILSTRVEFHLAKAEPGLHWAYLEYNKQTAVVQKIAVSSEMEVINRIVSESDAKNRQLEFPAGSLWAFPMPDGQNSVDFVASDIHGQQWRLKVSIRNKGKYEKPLLKGEWGDYVHQKQLRKGDKVILTMNEEENGERIYRISAERKHYGFWYSIDEQQ